MTELPSPTWLPRIIFCILLFIPTIRCLCTFPTELQGIWTTGKRGNITITDEFMFNVELDAVGAKTFQCQEIYGDRYIVKTTNTFSYIDPTLIFSALMCLDFRYVTTDFYYFYLGSNNTGQGRIFFNLDDLAVPASSICAVDPTNYVLHSYDVMIREGNIEGAKQPCPGSLQRTWSYDIDQGFGNLCTVEQGSMDVCTRTEISMNYTQCSAPVAYSATGVMNCLVSVYSGGTTYVTLHNNDTSVDGVNTFRFTCWAYASSGGNLLMTQHPQQCLEDQNSTYVDISVGATLFLSNGALCYTTTPEDLTWMYITIGCVCGAFIIMAIVVFIYFFSRYKAKQKPFRGGLEPANMSPRVPYMMNGHKIAALKPSPGIPESDAPVNVMQLLRKDLATPAGRDTPTSNFNVTINTPPQLFNVREIDSYGPSPTIESSDHKKDYHVLGGADQSEYGDLPLDEDDKTSQTPVMVLPMKSSGFAPEEMEDDYDDDDDDLLTTPGRSRLVAARQGTHGIDALCPATRLPGITEDVALTYNDSSRVGARKALPSIGGNITFLNEYGIPLPPRSPTPPGKVETVRDSNSKLRVKSKRRASLTKDLMARGEDVTPRDSRGPAEPDRGEDPDKVEMVFTVIKPDRKLETGIGPASARSGSTKKGGKPPGALLRSRSAGLDYRRGEQDKRGTNDAKVKDSEQDANAHPDIKITQSEGNVPGKDNSEDKTSKKDRAEGKSPRKDNPEGKTPRRERTNATKETPRKRPKSVSGPRELHAKECKSDRGLHNHIPPHVDADEPARPRSSLRLTRVDIPDLTPPAVPGTKASSKPPPNEVIDSPGRLSQKSPDDSIEAKPRKMWLDPVRANTQVWGQMSSVWRDGQVWPHKSNHH